MPLKALVQDGSCPPTDRDSKDVVMIPTVFISLLQGLWTPVDDVVMIPTVFISLLQGLWTPVDYQARSNGR